MAIVCGVGKPWFREKIDTLKSSVLTFISSQSSERDENHFLKAVGFFPPHAFPEATHYRVIPLVSLIEVRNCDVLLFRLQGDPLWHSFHVAAGFIKETDARNSVLSKRILIAKQVQSSLQARFGDVAKGFSVESLYLTLALNRVQVFIYNKDLPGVVFLMNLVLVDRDYLLPEPEMREVQWVPSDEVHRKVLKNPELFHPLTRIHVLSAVKF